MTQNNTKKLRHRGTEKSNPNMMWIGIALKVPKQQQGSSVVPWAATHPQTSQCITSSLISTALGFEGENSSLIGKVKASEAWFGVFY